jgi:cell division protein FtsW (lipid II flippase)
MALLGLYLYYIFFVFYMVATCEKWWHAALAIGIATAFLVLSFCLAAMQSNKKPSFFFFFPEDSASGHYPN